MQIKIFTLPISSSERSEDELNKFLRSHRVLKTEHHFCPDDGGYWTFLVEYLEGNPIAEVPPANRREKKDYSKELNEEETARFEYFKKVRRELATKFSLPAYLIFTNEELAILAQVPELSEETVKQVKGGAPSRMKNYSNCLSILHKFLCLCTVNLCSPPLNICSPPLNICSSPVNLCSPPVNINIHVAKIHFLSIASNNSVAIHQHSS